MRPSSITAAHETSMPAEGPWVTELSCAAVGLAHRWLRTYTGGKELRMQSEADQRARAAPLAKILVVDDEQRILRFIVRGLQLEGYEVDSADTGTAGLPKALQSQNGLVILDL